MILFRPKDRPGTYKLTLRSDVLDHDGNPLDVDGDGIEGEPIQDRYEATVHLVDPVRPDLLQEFHQGLPSGNEGWTIFDPGGIVDGDEGRMNFRANLTASAAEAILHVDVFGAKDVVLEFDNLAATVSQTTPTRGDLITGDPPARSNYVAISDDHGDHWYVIDELSESGHISITVVDAINRAGMRFTDEFQIKFNRFVPAHETADAAIDNVAVRATFPDAAIVSRQLFYRGSRDAAGKEPPSMSLAPLPVEAQEPMFGKRALLPGQSATFQNYTSYSRGINGIVIDVTGISELGAVDENMFVFTIGNNNATDSWQPAPSPSSIRVAPGAGALGADRITIQWDDNSIRNTWLKVVMLATPQSGLESDEVHYWGNRIGETGNSTSAAIVDEQDEFAARNNSRTFVNPATLANPYDFNRDRRVNATDEILARNQRSEPPLQLIAVPEDTTKRKPRLPRQPLRHPLDQPRAAAALRTASVDIIMERWLPLSQHETTTEFSLAESDERAMALDSAPFHNWTEKYGTDRDGIVTMSEHGATSQERGKLASDDHRLLKLSVFVITTLRKSIGLPFVTDFEIEATKEDN